MLIVGGLSGAGITTYFEEYRTTFISVTIAFLGTAFYLTYRRSGSPQSGRAAKIMLFNKVMLWTATVFVGVFLFFPQMTSQLFATGDDYSDFTDQMERTVLTIEGMT